MEENYSLEKNAKHGYMEIIPKPSQKELEQYYGEKYYQDLDPNFTYSSAYSDEELKMITNTVDLRYSIIENIMGSGDGKRYLDVGCGEGFAMDYFAKKSWDVLGIDYSAFSIENFHPHLMGNFEQCDVLSKLKDLVRDEERFDVLWIDNVLEHVIDPEGLIQMSKDLLVDGGVLMVQVPNDFSAWQNALIETGKISKKHWICYPDHLNYFTRESLISLVESEGFETDKVIADFPIELFLANQSANYVEDKNVGKSAHLARVYWENFTFENNKKEDFVSFLEQLAKIHQGRSLIGFFQRK